MYGIDDKGELITARRATFILPESIAAKLMLTALQVIATTHDEDNEWEGRDKFRALRDYARSTVAKVTAT